MALQPRDRAKAKHQMKTAGRNIVTPKKVLEHAKREHEMTEWLKWYDRTNGGWP